MTLWRIPDGFNLTGGWDTEGAGDDVSDIATAIGLTYWGDIIGYQDGYDPSNLRPGAYMTPQEAIRHADEIGLVEYIVIVYDQIENRWHIVVDY